MDFAGCKETNIDEAKAAGLTNRGFSANHRRCFSDGWRIDFRRKKSWAAYMELWSGGNEHFGIVPPGQLRMMDLLKTSITQVCARGTLQDFGPGERAGFRAATKRMNLVYGWMNKPNQSRPDRKKLRETFWRSRLSVVSQSDFNAEARKNGWQSLHDRPVYSTT